MSSTVTSNTRRFWTAITIGFAVGAISLIIASLIDLATTDLSLAELVPYALEYVLAGLTFAICYSIPFRSMLTMEAGPVAAVKRAIYSCTTATALFVAAVVVTAPKFPVRWLLYLYAISIVLEWLAWRVLPVGELDPPAAGSRSARVASYLDAMPHAPFALVGMLLLVLTPFFLLANQQPSAERVSNWAFGFLVLAVAVALCRVFTPDALLRLARLCPTMTGGLLAVALLAVGYLSVSAYTQPEQSFLVDVQPSYLARVVTDKDVVISDSPKLRLGNIPDMTAHLDLLPDQRGLALWDDLISSLQGKRNAYWVNVADDSHDSQGILASFLKSNGCLDDIPGTILPVKPYELQSPLVKPRVVPPTLADWVADAFQSAKVDFGPIQMTGYNFEPRVCSHDAVAVSLRWNLVDRTGAPLKVSLILNDSKGRQIQAQDFQIQDAEQRTSDQTDAGTRMLGYHLLVVPFGTPPGEYTVSAGVYLSGASERLHVNSAQGVAAAADLVTLGSVQVYRAQDIAADPFKTLQDSHLVQAKVDLQTGMRLAAYGVATQSVLPGEDVSLTARWRSLLTTLPSYNVRVQVMRGDQVIAEASGAPVDGTYPTSQWRADEVVVDHWDVRVPPDAAGGPAQVNIGIDGGKSLYVTDVDIATVTHTFQIPSMGSPAEASFAGVGDLIGYDLESTSVSAGTPLLLTLYWRAGSSAIDKNYTVFAQLLAADGHLVAQSDSAPDGGKRATRGWVSGEIIADPHTLDFGDASYRGSASLIVGIYDPRTGKRVAIQGSSDDHVKLNAPIQVKP
ncbi:MAG: hypothetical protein M1570_02035 [Chloroflexi bacterium]|nr:hypothetical protein [Chloroflexota bacterium]